MTGEDSSASASSGSQPGSDLPPRADLLIKGGYVLTLDPDQGGIPSGEVHVRDGEIVAVGRRLEVPRQTKVVDARDRIVMPGFVDGHWHLWNTMLKSKLRSVRGESDLGNYLEVKATYGPLYRPVDSYRSVRLSLAEALSNGITTVLNFNHNLVSRAHADLELRAHHEMGVRTLYGYGTVHGSSGPISESDVLHIKDTWFGPRADTSVVYGLAVCPGEALAQDMAMARRHGLPIVLHRLGDILTENLAGPDVLVVHSYRVPGPPLHDAEIAAAGAAGVRFGTAPTIESQLGPTYYSNAVNVLRALGYVGVSVDSSGLNTADMFNAMRAMLSSSVSTEAKGLDPFTAEEIVTACTMGTARYHGIENRVGSLTPGKRADIQLLRTDDATLAPFDARTVDGVYEALVHGGNPTIVDTVIVDGRVLRWRGNLTHVKLDRIVADAAESLAWLTDRAGA